MIVIATGAAVVASQALISGAYSLTQQAMQLGFVPRMRLIHTSATLKGQIYMPGVNTALWVACIALVLAFGSSSALAATYGVAVTGAMLTTTVLFAYVMRVKWRWPLWAVVVLTTLFLVVDAAFFAANLLKVPDGGWFPLVAALLVFLLMTTWKRGRRQVTAILKQSSLPLDLFLPDIAKRKPLRVPGVAVFMTSLPDVAPPVLLHHLKHNKVLHEKIVLMTVAPQEIPQVDDAERVTVLPRGEGFYEVVAQYGFMETPDVPAVLDAIGGRLHEEGEADHATLKMTDVSFYLGRETLIVKQRGRGTAQAAGAMWGWRARLFSVMARNAQSATAYFGLPPNRVVELGAQIQV
jgi:KUP system potassium uptake protein